MALTFPVREAARYTVLSKLSAYDAEMVQDVVDNYFEAESETRLVEVRRVRLERLLQCTGRDFNLRFAFSDTDRLGRGRIQAAAEAPGQGAILPLKAGALRLLGHYLAQSAEVARRAQEDEAAGKPRFAALWHALENARVENRMIERWPGMRTTFAAAAAAQPGRLAGAGDVAP